MTLRIKKCFISLGNWKTNALIFIPSEKVPKKNVLAVFTHGYTSHKGSILTWPTRLVEEGVASILFDLPGHYLGGFNEVNSFEEFKNKSHEMFISAFEALKDEVGYQDQQLIFSGHSLGGLLCIKALGLDYFKDFRKIGIAVGLGLAPEKGNHLFESDFYKSTLIIREQLVSEVLSHKNVFAWLKEEKESISISNQKIHLITGEDDLVVGKTGSERLKDLLESKGNQVGLDKPNKLPHHMPEMSASHIKKYLKQVQIL